MEVLEGIAGFQAHSLCSPGARRTYSLHGPAAASPADSIRLAEGVVGSAEFYGREIARIRAAPIQRHLRAADPVSGLRVPDQTTWQQRGREKRDQKRSWAGASARTP